MNKDDDVILDIETYRSALEITRIGNRAVHKAQEKNRRLGIPNSYTINGILYFEKPNGELTTENLLEQMMRERGFL